MTRFRIKLALAGAGLLGLAAGASGIAPRRSAPSLDLARVARAAFDTARPLLAPDELPPDRKLGSFQLTYYWTPTEGARRSRTVRIYRDGSCRPLGRVSRSFARRMEVEGSGRLRDGRVLIYAGACSCPRSPCFRVAPRGHAWGTGSDDRPLLPFRSVAVDPRRVPIGTVLYIPELDGLRMPGHVSYGGFVHDGCVVADDRGGGVRGRQIDFFAGLRAHYRALRHRYRLRRVTVFEGGERCRRLGARLAERRREI